MVAICRHDNYARTTLPVQTKQIRVLLACLGRIKTASHEQHRLCRCQFSGLTMRSSVHASTWLYAGWGLVDTQLLHFERDGNASLLQQGLAKTQRRTTTPTKNTTHHRRRSIQIRDSSQCRKQIAAAARIASWAST